MTKVDIISGFLGAGKTTLIKKLISEVFAGQQIVLIENEFGEIGVDGGFLKDAGINITEMNSGCICCSLVGDFATALTKVVDEYHPARIIIEPSGVGKLSDVEGAVMNVAEEAGLEIATATAVVDVKKAKLYMKNFGEFFNNQIETARCIVLSRTQDVTQEKLDEALALIRGKNQEASVITTSWDEIDGSVIFGAMTDAKALEHELELEHHHHEHEHHHDHDHEHHHEHEHEHDHEHHHDHDHDHDHEHEHHHEHDHDHDHEHEHHHDHDHHHHHHDHDADEVFTSWGRETAKKFSRDELSGILDRLASGEEFGQVLRAKGIVPSDDGKWLHFDLTPGETEIREGAADYTGRLCVIGAQIDEEGLAKLFGV
ncbi:MAG: GTP-binding protein [Lachnospiraceae bacterium]|nr:GTP-binding protein [Lachnospiraceae bacterium]